MTGAGTGSFLPHEYPPMETQLVQTIPDGDGWLYEPKWDGFRCIAFCENGAVDLRSKNGQSLTRYFPEIVRVLENLSVKDFVIDGELMIWHGKTPSFDDLLQRIHPAESRVKRLAQETPASYIVFDLLMDSTGTLLVEKDLTHRRRSLEEFAEKYFAQHSNLMLSPATENIDGARLWFDSKGVELDGVIAKRMDLPYQSGNRKGAVKIKRAKSADCVIGGFRYGTNSKDIGSVLLGLYDNHGELHHVGFSSAFTASEKKALTQKLEPLKADHSFTINIPGGPSRWNHGKKNEWVPLTPKLVVEVQYDHVTNDRFRHGTKVLRWRVDKNPEQCKFDQLT